MVRAAYAASSPACRRLHRPYRRSGGTGAPCTFGKRRPRLQTSARTLRTFRRPCSSCTCVSMAVMQSQPTAWMGCTPQLLTSKSTGQRWGTGTSLGHDTLVASARSGQVQRLGALQCATEGGQQKGGQQCMSALCQGRLHPLKLRPPLSAPNTCWHFVGSLPSHLVQRPPNSPVTLHATLPGRGRGAGCVSSGARACSACHHCPSASCLAKAALARVLPVARLTRRRRSAQTWAGTPCT